MKYVILIHSNPQPWGHPTSDHLPEYQAQSPEDRDRRGTAFDTMLADLQERGEMLGAQALGDPAAARLLRWRDGEQLVVDGPYSETKEHLAGFFLIDVESSARAEEVARAFSGPGETIELRPLMWPGGEDE